MKSGRYLVSAPDVDTLKSELHRQVVRALEGGFEVKAEKMQRSTVTWEYYVWFDVLPKAEDSTLATEEQ